MNNTKQVITFEAGQLEKHKVAFVVANVSTDVIKSLQAQGYEVRYVF